MQNHEGKPDYTEPLGETEYYQAYFVQVSYMLPDHLAAIGSTNAKVYYLPMGWLIAVSGGFHSSWEEISTRAVVMTSLLVSNG